MAPDDEGVVGAIVGAKIGKSATPILVPILLLGVAAAAWNFWLGPIVLKTIARLLPLLILLAVLSGLLAAGTIIHRFRQASVLPAGDAAPAARPWYAGLVAVPLKISVGAVVLFAVLVQIGLDNPWPPKPQPIVAAPANPASTTAQH